MFEQIKERYNKGYITDDQLNRYVALKIITEGQANEIRSNPSPELDYVKKLDLDEAYQEGVNSYV